MGSDNFTKAINMDVDVSDFCTIENPTWLAQKPLSGVESEPIILLESIIEEDLFETCCKFIGRENPFTSIFGK